MRDDDVWFEPKSYGYGSGLPVAWQGWALLGGYMVALMALAVTTAERHPILFVVLTIVMTAALLVVSAQHTRGGWRWRWGGD